MISSGNPIAIVCRYCGSKDVARDAWAAWDEEEQRWKLHGDPLDDATCFNCDSETTLEETPLVGHVD